MKIEISNFYNNHGKEFFKYELHDGPNNIEKVRGYASDLVIAFTKILEWHERISRDYDDYPLPFLFFDGRSQFPETGVTGTIYVEKLTGDAYVWAESRYLKTDLSINEGQTLRN